LTIDIFIITLSPCHTNLSDFSFLFFSVLELVV
jgi:hypothetical protein